LSELPASRLLSKGEFFLIPLQVHNDAQIEFHSQYESIEHFIQEVMLSFALNQRTEHLLIKHHPMDRGHVNYKGYIAKLAKELGIAGKVYYIHDQHLPTLLKACKGVVTINSTTALQAFYHEAPVKVMGSAFFNMPGLTDQKTLAEFWQNPQKPDMEFSDRFRGYLLDHGQINGSFYCQFRFTCDNIVDYMFAHGMLDLKPTNNI
jgi:capsular polysaccharide export protein